MEAPPTEAAARPRFSPVDLLFAATIVSLFLDFKLRTDLGVLRPFLFMGLACTATSLVLYGTRALVLPAVLLAHAAFLAWHVACAGMVSGQNALREGLQILSILLFVLALVAHYRARPQNAIMRYTAFLLVGLALYVALWHWQAGFLAGFKHLGEPKAAFIALPAVIAGWLAAKRRGLIGLAVVLVALVLIVLAGERKALICAALFAVGFAGFSLARVSAVVVLAPALFLTALALDSTGYVARQIDSIANIGVWENVYALDEEENYPRSMSNAQRQFATELGFSLVSKSPLVGIGTNGFIEVIRSDFRHLPRYLQVSIHGEFLRVLVENGLIGLALYLTSWLLAARRLWRTVPFGGLLRGLRGPALVRVLVFGACLVFSAFESAKSLTFLAFLIPPLLPLMVPDRPAPSRAPAAQVSNSSPAIRPADPRGRPDQHHSESPP
jgi:O-antigen ligase